MSASLCQHCGGALFVTEDAYGYGNALGCVSCSRQPQEKDWQPMPYSRWEPKRGQPAATIARDLSGTCIDCRAAIGPRAIRCNACHKRGYDERRKVRDRARRAGVVAS